MLPTRPLKSATFRLTIAFLAIFGLSASALLTFVYLSSTSFMERQTVETIEAELLGLREQFVERGFAGLVRTIRERAAAAPDLLSVYLLTDADGRYVAGNLRQWPTKFEETDDGILFVAHARVDGGKPTTRNVLAQPFTIKNRANILVGRDIEDKLQTQAMLRRVSLAGLAIMTLFGLAAGFVMSRWTLRRLENVNRTTTRIIEGDLTRRIDLHGTGDEFDELAGNLNVMLERIERLLAGMRQVTDNIAHDLRTPLNRLRSRAEVALLGDLDGEAARDILSATVADADALIATFNALLDITRAEAGEKRAATEPIRLSELIADVYELYEPVAEEKGVEFRNLANLQSPATVSGNRQLLAQAIANLIDNAIKYTSAGGKVEVSVHTDPCPTVEVTDSGTGIPAEHRDRALERFVRLDPDRSGPGNGLGLSLVKAVARLHEADLSLSDNAPGLRVAIAFPTAKTA